MLQDTGCNVVQCGDKNCKFCSTIQAPGNIDTSTAYVVYTCESPNCSLCRVETDVLLDLFCPFNSAQDIKEITKKLNTVAGSDQQPVAPAVVVPFIQNNTGTNNQSLSGGQPNSGLIRELLLQGNPSRNLDLDLADLNDVSLMDLALEMQLDKIADLPELKEQGLLELI